MWYNKGTLSNYMYTLAMAVLCIMIKLAVQNALICDLKSWRPMFASCYRG